VTVKDSIFRNAG